MANPNQRRKTDLETGLNSAYDLLQKLEQRELVSLNDPVTSHRVQLDIKETKSRIAQLEQELEDLAATGSSPLSPSPTSFNNSGEIKNSNVNVGSSLTNVNQVAGDLQTGGMRFGNNNNFYGPVGGNSHQVNQESGSTYNENPAYPSAGPSVERSAPSPGRASGPVEFKQFSELVKRLVACPSLATPAGRQSVVGQLPVPIRNSIHFAVTSGATQEVAAIVKTCQNFPDGLSELFAIVRFYDAGTIALSALETYLQEIGLT